MPRQSLVARSIGATIAHTIGESRRAIGWSQRELAAKVGCAQSSISKLERQRGDCTLALLGRTFDQLGVRARLVVDLPMVVGSRRDRDAAHARCVGAARRYLERHRWLVATEVEIIDGRWHGWIDLLAFHPGTRVLLVIEVKTQLTDIGALERQIGWYERAAWAAARRRGWRPDAVRAAVLLLDSAENHVTLRDQRTTLQASYPIRADRLNELVEHGRLAGDHWPARARALASVDPASRRRAWLKRTPLDGRVPDAPYLDYADFVRRTSQARRPIRQPSSPLI
ncbi:MAG TPA: helix-turn-helix domain-containing protein [Candidatus Limnocylindrales bacterium]|nr:helix-turn-helix domain-containing protein [Candidatus Limnocylindrales bacterium]